MVITNWTPSEENLPQYQERPMSSTKWRAAVLEIYEKLNYLQQYYEGLELIPLPSTGYPGMVVAVNEASDGFTLRDPYPDISDVSFINALIFGG